MGAEPVRDGAVLLPAEGGEDGLPGAGGDGRGEWRELRVLFDGCGERVYAEGDSGAASDSICTLVCLL